MQPVLKSLLSERIQRRLNLAAEKAAVFVDPIEFQRLIINLVINAKDAMPEGGTVTIETRLALEEGPARVELTVADSGMGMPSDVQDRVFDPFFTTKPAGSGTGLGLAVAYGIVKRAGGSIRLESHVGEGTRFSITFPFSAEHTAERPKGSDLTAKALTGTTVLLVEDDESVRASTAETLRGFGCHVLEAGSCREALSLVTDGLTIDVILTDVVLPDGRGPALVGEMRRVVPAATALFMSGCASEMLTHAEVSISHDCLLRKPFSAETLADQLRILLQHQQSAARAER